jgi:hypothetical protein
LRVRTSRGVLEHVKKSRAGRQLAPLALSVRSPAFTEAIARARCIPHARTHVPPFITMAAFAATTPSLKVRPRVEPPRARGARATRVSGRDCRATRAKKSPIRVCRGGPSLGIAGVARARRRRDARD